MAKAQRKTEARLAKRRSSYPGGDAREHRIIPASGPGAQTYHRPGSQNRNK